jgi:hypothetical protein
LRTLVANHLRKGNGVSSLISKISTASETVITSNGKYRRLFIPTVYGGH